MNVIFGVGEGVGVGAKYNFEKAPRLGLEPRTCELTAPALPTELSGNVCLI